MRHMAVIGLIALTLAAPAAATYNQDPASAVTYTHQATEHNPDWGTSSITCTPTTKTTIKTTIYNAYLCAWRRADEPTGPGSGKDAVVIAHTSKGRYLYTNVTTFTYSLTDSVQTTCNLTRLAGHAKVTCRNS